MVLGNSGVWDRESINQFRLDCLTMTGPPQLWQMRQSQLWKIILLHTGTSGSAQAFHFQFQPSHLSCTVIDLLLSKAEIWGKSSVRVFSLTNYAVQHLSSKCVTHTHTHTHTHTYTHTYVKDSTSTLQCNHVLQLIQPGKSGSKILSLYQLRFFLKKNYSISVFSSLT